MAVTTKTSKIKNPLDALTPKNYTPNIKELQAENNIGSIESPMGASALPEATPKQIDMAGTPAQRQAQVSEQQKQAAEEAAKARQAAAAPKTLEEAERYAKPTAAPQAFEQARQKAQALTTLGPARTRIESLIEDRLTTFEAPELEITLNEDAIMALPPDQQEGARTALNALIAAEPAGREAALQDLYDVVGGSQLADVARFFNTDANTLANVLAPVVTQEEGEVRIELNELDLTGIDTASIALALGIPEESLLTMTLDEIDQQINLIEQREFNEIANLTAQLSDPTLSFQRKQAIQQRLLDLGASGYMGIEQSVDILQEQLDAEVAIEVAGKEYSVEDLLSDEGMSELIAEAVKDEDFLAELKDDPRFAKVAEWVEENRFALSNLVGEYQTTATAFTDTQDQAASLFSSLGETDEAKALLASMLGVDELPSSITAAELEAFQKALEDNPVYQLALEDELFLDDLLANPEQAEEMYDLISSVPTTDEEGNPLSPEEAQAAQQAAIDDMYSLYEKLSDDPALAYLFGEAAYYTDYEELQNMLGEIARYDALDEGVRELDSSQLERYDLSIDLLEDINAVLADMSDQDKAATLSAIITDFDEREAARKQYLDLSADNVTDMIGPGAGWNAIDINIALKDENIDQETKDLLIALFDHNQNGVVTDEEINSDKTVAAFKKNILGLTGNEDADKRKIIEAGGDIDVEAAIDKLAGGVNPSADIELATRLSDERQASIEGVDDFITSMAKTLGLDFTSATSVADINKKIDAKITEQDNKISEAQERIDTYNTTKDANKAAIGDAGAAIFGLKMRIADIKSKMSKLPFSAQGALQRKAYQDDIDKWNKAIKKHEANIDTANDRIKKLDKQISDTKTEQQGYRNVKITVSNKKTEWNDLLTAHNTLMALDPASMTDEELYNYYYGPLPEETSGLSLKLAEGPTGGSTPKPKSNSAAGRTKGKRTSNGKKK